MSESTVKVSTFLDLDITGSKPTPVSMETIEVDFTTENLLGQYAKAFVNEARRVAPLKAEQIQLTADEVEKYCAFLLYQRVLCVKGECTLYRKLKVLYMPVWIQYNLAMVGEVNIRERGLKLMPNMVEPEMTYEEALRVSDKIGSFERDLQIVQDAMPRDIHGDKDVMSTAMIAGYVHALEKVEHVSSTYVTAFLGMKLKEEAAFKVLYRVQYDDLEYIASALMTEKRIFGGV